LAQAPSPQQPVSEALVILADDPLLASLSALSLSDYTEDENQIIEHIPITSAFLASVIFLYSIIERNRITCDAKTFLISDFTEFFDSGIHSAQQAEFTSSIMALIAHVSLIRDCYLSRYSIVLALEDVATILGRDSFCSVALSECLRLFRTGNIGSVPVSITERLSSNFDGIRNDALEACASMLHTYRENIAHEHESLLQSAKDICEGIQASPYLDTEPTGESNEIDIRVWAPSDCPIYDPIEVIDPNVE
jgi:hypothetical protein